MAKRLTLALVLGAFLVALFPQVAQAATFIVNSTADPGTGGCNAAECTLREAILAANSNPTNNDTINFNIPGVVPHTITPLTALPDVSRNVTIDATTEPDYAGRPVVELNGSLAGPANGLSLAGSGVVGQSVVKGLAINRFRFSGIDVRSSANTVQANYIGTDTTGTLALGNGGGVNVESFANTIGGTTAAGRNVISGNTGEGVRIAGAAATGNVVQGNYIGTDASGTLPLGNGAGARGVLVGFAGSNNIIGGTAAGARNVISANGAGIWIALGTGGNTIQGNYIGTNATGTAPLGNSSEGIIIQQSPNNLVGGTSPAARNVISANGRGVTIQQGGTSGNRVQGNYIGTDATGTNPMGNRDVGVFLLAAASGNTIGGSAAGAGNVIAFNGPPWGGVYVDTGRDNAILANSIFSNGGLGIDLGVLGPTPNDPGDGDTGANQLQNFPVITKATTDGSATVEGSLNSMPSTTYRIEIFSSPSCDPSGFGEGQTFRTSVSVSTDASGNATFTTGAGAVPQGHVITATATDPAGNTSEFSACREVRPARATPATLTLSPRAASNPVDTQHTITATVADAGGAPIPGVVVRFSVTGSVSTSGSCTADDAGQCDFTYRGPTSPGTDAISAFADTDEDTTQDTGEPGDVASKVWAAAAPNTVVLTPAADTNPVGTRHTVTATVKDAFGNPTPGITVRFSVTGAATASGSCTTGADGECDFTYDGPTAPGVDAIEAFADTDGDTERDADEPRGAAEKTWVPGDPATVMLDPAADQNPVDTQHCVTATVKDAFGNPVPGVRVRFAVTGAVETGGSAATDANGEAEFCYQGPRTTGADAITAFADTNDDGDRDPGEPAGAAAKTWVAGAPATVVLTPAADTNPVGTQHTVTATVTDAFGNPTPGITVRFSVTGAGSASGSCTTDAQGQCGFSYGGPTTPGVDAITAFADTNNNSSRDAGEPQGAAEKTWVPGPPNTVVLTPAADTNPVGTQHTVTATVTDAFGNPTPGITVRFSVTGSVAASGSCTTGADGRCSFTYQGPELPGSDAITAFADTNNNSSRDAGEPQGVAEKTWVLPLSTPLCEVMISDGGRITANNGDKATFGGNAKVSETRQASGEQQYTDHGPAQPFNLNSIQILAVTCSADGKEANVYGRATIDGSGDHIFLIQVRDAGKSGKNDTYRILIDNGYDSGVHRLEGGNVSIKAR